MTFDSDEPLIGQEMSDDKWILSDGKAIVVNNNKIEDIQDSKESLDDYESHSTNSKELQLIDVNGKAPNNFPADRLLKIQVMNKLELEIIPEFSEATIPADNISRIVEIVLINHGNSEEAL